MKSKITPGNGRRSLQYAGHDETGTENAGADDRTSGRDLDAREYDVNAGGGAVSVKINGKKEILSISIKPEIVDPDDIETLSDVLVAAVNEAIRKVEDVNTQEMQRVTGNVSIPGLF